jgi:hypothetical protein
MRFASSAGRASERCTSHYQTSWVYNISRRKKELEEIEQQVDDWVTSQNRDSENGVMGREFTSTY